MTYIVPLVVGIVTVVQAALNRRVSEAWGLLPAAVLNAMVFFALAIAALIWARTLGGPFASLASRTLVLRDFQLTWFFPGLFGFCVVLGLPWAIERLGALQTFVIVVAAQMVASACWDQLVEGIAIDARRVVGALLAVAGAIVISFK